MKFVTVNPATVEVASVNADGLDSVYEMIGLSKLEVDHSVVVRSPKVGISVATYQYGLFVPKERQRYFSICCQLFGGNAALYAFDNAGETVDLPFNPPVMFYRSADEVERAISVGGLVRPELRVNSILVWQWPMEVPPEVFENFEARAEPGPPDDIRGVTKRR